MSTNFKLLGVTTLPNESSEVITVQTSCPHCLKRTIWTLSGLECSIKLELTEYWKQRAMRMEEMLNAILKLQSRL